MKSMNLSNVCNYSHQMPSIGAKLALEMKPNAENDMFGAKVKLGAKRWRCGDSSTATAAPKTMQRVKNPNKFILIF